ncbi:MAG: hypothetical protein F6K32_23950 [Desertifilum sp. SIO1I2]|nr:hypothetical protein [Desertifilum sp. SIO1I2]
MELADEETGSSELQNRLMACIYQPDGHCKHVLDERRAAWLYQGYLHMQRKHANVMHRLQAGTFAEELYLLLERYTPGKPHPLRRDRELKQKDLKSVTTLHPALNSLMGNAQERFASPLDASFYAVNYWTPYARDQVFGASYNAYKVKWTGPSIAVPDFDKAATAEAVEWAIKSAQTVHEPSLALLVVPAHYPYAGDTIYEALVAYHPHLCQTLAHIPRRCMPLATEDHAMRALPPRPNQGFYIIAIGNASGFEKYLPLWEPRWRSDFRDAVRRACLQPKDCNQDITFWDLEQATLRVEPPTHGETIWDATTTKKFRRRPLDITRPGRLPDHVFDCKPNSTNSDAFNDRKQRIDATVAEALQNLKRLQPRTPELLHDWRRFRYTDGSCIDLQNHGLKGSSIGAAVHIPARQPGEGPANQQDGTTLFISCAHKETSVYLQNCNSINRAELTAILTALQHSSCELPLHTDIHIATDSLGSIYQIHRMLCRPQDMREHRHAHLIMDIVREIGRQRGTVHLWKVKSHVGIIGNERADKAAQAVAKGEIGEEDLTQCSTASNCRTNMYWPHITDFWPLI